jgi:ABC-type transporter Mla subunit MlaD
MPDQPPPRPTAPGLADLFNLLGTNNPISVMTKSAEQFRTGVSGFIDAVQSFRQTMDNLNAMTARMNRLMDDIEEPIRTVVPEITRSADTAARMIAILRGPVERVAPALDQLAELLSNPVVVDLPRRLNETLDVVSSIPRMLSPVGQVAELAGGLFSNARGFPGLSMTTRPAHPEPSPDASEPDEEADDEPAPPPRKAAKKTAAKKTAAKKTAAKKSAPKRAAAKKSARP